MSSDYIVFHNLRRKSLLSEANPLNMRNVFLLTNITVKIRVVVIHGIIGIKLVGIILRIGVCGIVVGVAGRLNDFRASRVRILNWGI